MLRWRLQWDPRSLLAENDLKYCNHRLRCSIWFPIRSNHFSSEATACLAQVLKDPKDIGTYMGMGMLNVSFGALIGPPINGGLFAHYRGLARTLAAWSYLQGDLQWCS